MQRSCLFSLWGTARGTWGRRWCQGQIQAHCMQSLFSAPSSLWPSYITVSAGIKMTAHTCWREGHGPCPPSLAGRANALRRKDSAMQEGQGEHQVPQPHLGSLRSRINTKDPVGPPPWAAVEQALQAKPSDHLAGLTSARGAERKGFWPTESGLSWPQQSTKGPGYTPMGTRAGAVPECGFFNFLHSQLPMNPRNAA